MIPFLVLVAGLTALSAAAHTQQPRHSEQPQLTVVR